MPVMITSISPQKLLTGQSREIWLGGYGFNGEIAVLINGIFIPVYFATERLVKFVLPYIPAGQYAVTVLNGDNTQFIQRPGILISDPPAGVSIGTVGGADLPMVLPPQIIESSCNATLNSAQNNSNYKSAATVYSDPATGLVTANKTLFSSTVPTEPFTGDTTSTTPSAGSTVSSPFGTFTN